MTDSAPAIAAAPIVDALRPIISAVVTTIVGVAVTFAVALLTRWTGVTLQSTYVDSIRQAAQTEAGVLIAEAADNLSSRSIPVASPAIVAAAARITATMPEAMKAVGMTPDALQRLVAGEIGKLQAQATAVSVPPPISRTQSP
jgi:nitrogen fixation protein FixH